jgi:hypothetical protein
MRWGFVKSQKASERIHEAYCILNKGRAKEGIPVVVSIHEEKAVLEEQMTELAFTKVGWKYGITHT